MNELNHSEGKFDLKIIGDFSECETEITSSITDDQLSFKIEVKSGMVDIKKCFIIYRGIVLQVGEFNEPITDGGSLTIDYDNSLIRFIK